MKELFKKPKWLKPEINEPIYYVHLIIIGVIALAILDYSLKTDMLTIINVLKSVPILLAGDIVAHTILKLD